VHGARMAQYTPDEVAHKVREAWRAMAPERAAPYEAAAAKERDAWEAARRAYAGLQQTYQQLHVGAQQSGARALACSPPARRASGLFGQTWRLAAAALPCRTRAVSFTRPSAEGCEHARTWLSR